MVYEISNVVEYYEVNLIIFGQICMNIKNFLNEVSIMKMIFVDIVLEKQN